MKRQDILKYIRRLASRITLYGITSKITKNAIAYREDQLYNEFDPRFGEHRAKVYLKAAGMNTNTKYADNLQKVIKKLRNGEQVKGFTLLRTCKVKGHPTFIKVIDLDGEQTLCVAKTHQTSPRKKAYIKKLNEERWAKDGAQ